MLRRNYRHAAPRRRPPVATPEITLSFKTDDLLELFGLPTLDKVDDIGDRLDLPYPSDDDLLESSYLGLDRAEDDETGELKIWDLNDQEVTEEALDELKRCVEWAAVSGAQKRYFNEVSDTLGQCLETFSNTSYDYDNVATDEGYANASGTATGITDVTVKGEATEITTHTDLVHLINQCITGYGQYEVPEDDFDVADPGLSEEYIKEHFSWLNRYWEIFGDSKPEVDTDNLEDFDDAYFKELVADVEKQFGLKLLFRR